MPSSPTTETTATETHTTEHRPSADSGPEVEAVGADAPDDGNVAGSPAGSAPPAAVGPASPGRGDSRPVLCRLLVCLAVTVSLSSRHLVDTAEALPFGTKRTLFLATAEGVHGWAARMELDLPDRAVTELLGRDPGPDVFCGLLRAPCPALDAPPERTRPSSAPTTTVDPLATPVTVTVDFAAPTSSTEPAPAPPAAAAAASDAPGLGPAIFEPVWAGRTVAGTDPLSPVPPRAVVPEQKLRLWAGGDSLGEYVGNQLLSPVADRELAEIELDYRISTGLARPDYFDWQARIDELATREQPPEALVFMVGGNDNQPMERGDEVLEVGTDPWYAEYRARVVDIMDSADTGSSRLYWIGLPPMRDEGRETLARAINDIVAGEAAQRPWVTYVNITTTFTGPEGGFSTRIVGPDGTDRVARAPDGVHITYKGSTWVAQEVWETVGTHWGLN